MNQLVLICSKILTYINFGDYFNKLRNNNNNNNTLNMIVNAKLAKIYTIHY